MSDKEEKLELKNVDEALLYVMENCGYVQKTGKMKAGKINYNYAGEVDLIRALRPHIVKAGLTFRCIDIDIILNEDFTTSKTWDGVTTETLNHRILAKYTYIFKHAESQTDAVAVALGDGIDFGDKAGYKAATGALKYIFRQTFIIETGDDPDEQASEETQRIVPTEKNDPQVEKWVEEKLIDMQTFDNLDDLTTYWETQVVKGLSKPALGQGNKNKIMDAYDKAQQELG